MATPAERRARASVKPQPLSVLFKHPSGQRTKRVTPGFAWDLFLFSGAFGVPLFLRGLTNWGAAILALWVVDLAVGRLRPHWHLAAGVLLFAAFLGLQIYLGVKGNALTARACRARGWVPDNTRDAGVRDALQRWGIG